MMEIKSESALLYVKDSKKSGLSEYLEANGKIQVTIQGRIVESWGNFDGISKEYLVLVTNVICEEANQ